MQRAFLWLPVALLVPALASGCGVLLGINDYTDASTSASSNTGGHAGSTSAGGTGGTGGTGATGGTLCTPNMSENCYDGPPGTQDVAACRAGMHTCNAQGTAYGACDGQVVPLPDNCANTKDEDCTGSACGYEVWSYAIGIAEVPTALAGTPDGGVVMIGGFGANFMFPGGPTLINSGQNDVFLAKFDASGKHVWSKRFGDSQGQLGTQVAVDGQGNIFVAGATNGTINLGGSDLIGQGAFVAKLDKDGNHLWSIHLSGSIVGNSLQLSVDPLGNAYLASAFYGVADFGQGSVTSDGSSDFFLAKLNGSSGALSWVRVFGTNDVDYRIKMVVDGAGNAFVAGTFGGLITFGNGKSLVNAGSNIYLAKYDSAGTAQWAKPLGGAGAMDLFGVAIDSDGNLALTGTFVTAFTLGSSMLTAQSPGFSEWFSTKLNPSGNPIWAFSIGDPYDLPNAQFSSSDYFSIATDAQKNIFIAGNASAVLNMNGVVLTPDATHTYALAKFAPDGAHVWSRLFGDSGAGGVFCPLAVMSSGDPVVANHFSTAIDFGNGALSTASYDNFFARIATK